MADVFISYKRERRHAAAHIAEIVRGFGYTVWYDNDIDVGTDFSTEAQRQLVKARAAVILWCTLSVKSTWVKSEAESARNLGKIVPVWIEPTKETPLPFNTLDTVDLAPWSGAPRDLVRLERFLTRISQLVGRARMEQASLLEYEKLWERFGAPNLAQLISFGGGRGEGSPPPSVISPAGDEVPRIATLDREEADRLYAQEIAASRDAALKARPLSERAYRILLDEVENWPCPEMVVIPPGSFVMGARSNDPDASGDERPQHQVTIRTPFALGKHPVTLGEIQAWKDSLIRSGDHVANEIGKQPDQTLDGAHPATFVSWNDAMAFIEWLNGQLGLANGREAYRLPTEAEWEYACRGSTNGDPHASRFAFGDEISSSQANFGDSATGDRDTQRTTVVGDKPANAFGLHDMHGNVSEWVEDCWHANYEGAPSDGSAWLEDTTDLRVQRGGSWRSKHPSSLRSSSRFREQLTARNNHTGFRLARSLYRD